MLAQSLHLDMAAVRVVRGDTHSVPSGGGTWASRGMVVGGGNRVPDARQLCATARRFLDRERRLAAEPLLRLAAKHARSTPAARMEIGQLMLEAGMAEKSAEFRAKGGEIYLPAAE